MAMTDAQKRANDKYREQNKNRNVQLAVQYKADWLEGQRVKRYLAENNLSANAYIKQLIKADLDAKHIVYPDIPDTAETD